MSLRDRLAALERRSKGGGMLIIKVKGGLSPGLVPTTATAGGYRWRQQIDETEDAFADRVTKLATLAGEKILVIGGLPDTAADGSESL